MTKAFMPLLVKAKGTVVNISSVGAVVHTPWIGKIFLLLELLPTVVWVSVPGLRACGRHGRLSQRQRGQYCLSHNDVQLTQPLQPQASTALPKPP